MLYAIKYLKVPYDGDINILIPKKVIKGELEYDYFTSNKVVYSYITNEIKEGKYIVGSALTLEEIKKEYNLEKYSDKEVIELFFLFNQDKCLLEKNGKCYTLDVGDLFSEEVTKTVYECIDGETSLYLNKEMINALLETEDIVTLKETLAAFSDRLTNFGSLHQNTGIDKLVIKNGKITGINDYELVPQDKTSITTTENTETQNDAAPSNNQEINSDFTISGLYKYLKQHIIGHDEALKKISTILLMNYYSNAYYGTESILIPGPTGVGKTATFNCAANYFNVPFKNINTCNLVPEGIVGTTIEDEFSALIDECKGDMNKAEKAILVFDEFDKIGIDSLDIKATLVNVFLKALEGASFPINRQMRARQVYNTTLASKVCLGAFTEAYKKEKATIGFDSSSPKTSVFDKDLLIQKGYFTNELLTRIQHFIPYTDITDEDKLKIILESKLSAYQMKKERIKSQFGIDIIGDKEFAEGIINKLKSTDKSVRDINNIVSDAFLNIEYEILDTPGKYKTLRLNRDTATNGNFDLK